MRSVDVSDHRGPEHVAGTVDMRLPEQLGEATLWARRRILAPGARAVWGEAHRDEVVWVRGGRVRLPGADLLAAAGDVVVVESGVATSLDAVEAADLVQFGSHHEPSWELLGPPGGPRGCYVVCRDGRPETTAVLDGAVSVSTRFWADSTRPSSRVAFLEVAGDAGHHAPSHSHSGDEIIYVAHGQLRVGPASLEPDMSIFIPGGQRYRYSAAGEYAFVNFRPDASSITIKPGTSPHLETYAGLAAGPKL